MLLLLFRGRQSGPAPVVVVDTRYGTGRPTNDQAGAGRLTKTVSGSGRMPNQQ